jgi:hypothetical protein
MYQYPSYTFRLSLLYKVYIREVPSLGYTCKLSLTVQFLRQVSQKKLLLIIGLSRPP